MTIQRARLLEMLRLHDDYCSGSGQGKRLDFGDEDADLSGMDLSGKSFVETVFGRQNLSGADLSGCDLYRANFFEADLSNARLDETYLAKVKFDGANASHASFDLADLTNATFYHSNLRDATFRRTWHRLTEYNRADFRNANLRESVFDGTSFDEVVVNSTDATGAIGNLQCRDSWMEEGGHLTPIDGVGFIKWLAESGADDVHEEVFQYSKENPPSPAWKWRQEKFRFN